MKSDQSHPKADRLVAAGGGQSGPHPATKATRTKNRSGIPTQRDSALSFLRLLQYSIAHELRGIQKE